MYLFIGNSKMFNKKHRYQSQNKILFLSPKIFSKLLFYFPKIFFYKFLMWGKFSKTFCERYLRFRGGGLVPTTHRHPVRMTYRYRSYLNPGQAVELSGDVRWRYESACPLKSVQYTVRQGVELRGSGIAFWILKLVAASDEIRISFNLKGV